MSLIRNIIIAIFIVSPMAISAQKSLDSIVKTLEDSKKVTNQVYSECRSSENSNEITSINYIFEFEDEKIAEKIIQAIQTEKSQSKSYSVNKTNRKVIYNIQFKNADYTLIQKSDSSWMFMVNKTFKENKSKKKSRLKSGSSSKSTSKSIKVNGRTITTTTTTTTQS